MLRPLALAISLLFLGAAHPAQADAGISDLGTLYADNAYYSNAFGVNAVGDVVVGGTIVTSGATHAFRWTQAGGMIDLGTLGGAQSVANGVNAAGDVVVGSSATGSATHAFRWTAATNTMTDLGTLGGTSSVSRGVNAAGDVVVGYADTISTYHAFRWTQAGGMIDLGTLGGVQSLANGVNAAGDVVVGTAATPSTYHAFRWTQAGGMVDLGTLGGASSNANGVNAVGDVVVGQAAVASGDIHAFRWTAATNTMTDLGTLGGTTSSASGVNAAGDVVVGNASSTAGNRAFRWTQATGMQTIEDWLKSNGVTVNDSASKTFVAYGVNAAGDVVVGQLVNTHAFIATTQGLIDTDNVNRGLAASAGAPATATQGASMVINGAHGNPMRGLPVAGKQNMWLAGDWGHAESSKADGDQGAGEVGYAYGLDSSTTIKFALGRSYSKQDTTYGGQTRVDGTYLLPEFTTKIANTPLYATFSGYYHFGDSDVKRGYDNAGVREYSRGSADTETLGARARIDWLDAIKHDATALTPYTSLTYIRTKMDAYTETGGNFPAHWNSRSEHSTEARLGVDGVHQLDARLSLLGKLEGVHRFNNQGAASSGDVAGLYGFSFDGETYKRNWLRVGAGVEGKMGDGTGSLMLNASTENDAVRYWLAASYRQAF